MGRVRLKKIKRIGFELWEKYKDRFTDNFNENKRIVSELLYVPSKKLRNKVAGFLTHLVKLEKRRKALQLASESESKAEAENEEEEDRNF